jgi:hypothetical protein
MRGCLMPVLLSLALAAPAVASAAALDAGSLAGKTCQGTFNTGRKQEVSKGAIELRFASAGGGLTAQLSRAVGEAAYARAAYALSRGQPLDASGYEQLGPVSDLSVAAGKVRFTDPHGARVVLTASGRGFYGQSDPRGGSDPQMKRVAVVSMICR